MKIRVKIELFGTGSKARLYAIRLPEQTKPEVARFIDRILAGDYDQKSKRVRDALRTILDWLDRIARLDGAQERFFRPREGRGLALPIDKGPLRLYCYRLDDGNLLLCGGGLKQSQTIQTSPDCLPHFDIMNSVVSELKRQQVTAAQLPDSIDQPLHLEITLPTDYDFAR